MQKNYKIKKTEMKSHKIKKTKNMMPINVKKTMKKTKKTIN